MTNAVQRNTSETLYRLVVRERVYTNQYMKIYDKNASVNFFFLSVNLNLEEFGHFTITV